VAAKSGQHDIARRYATAFFALVTEQSKIAEIEKDMATLTALVKSGGDVTALMHDATLTRQQQADALVAIAKHLNVSALTEKLLGTLALKRRLPALPAVIAAVQERIAIERGEVTADVTAAQALDQKQIAEIEANLKKALGVTVRVNLNIDADIMGGLIIRVGSKMIDSSVRTKLERLHRALKNTNELSSQKKMKEVA
jgi:F-type H+-transporting ATPase subunit delta